MPTTLAISKYVNSLLEVEARFSARLSNHDRFFPEWHEDLPDLSATEKEHCDRIKERYFYHRDRGYIGESKLAWHKP